VGLEVGIVHAVGAEGDLRLPDEQNRGGGWTFKIARRRREGWRHTQQRMQAAVEAVEQAWTHAGAEQAAAAVGETPWVEDSARAGMASEAYRMHAWIQ
jgi:hypothetical protein